MIKKYRLYWNCCGLTHYFTSWLVGCSPPALYFRKITNQTTAIPVKPKYNGFTLIEVLIALSIFAILAVLSSAALYHNTHTEKRLQTQTQQLYQLQLMIALLTHDLQQVVPNNINQTNFVGDDKQLIFIRHNANNSQTLPFSKVTILCKHDMLLRNNKILLKHLTHCRLAYLDQKLQLRTNWHKQLPLAVQISLGHNWGPGQLLFPLLQ